MGEAVSLMIHIGDRLGLYEALANAGPVSSERLAEMTQLDERLLREWLYGQAAANLLDYHDDGTFELNAVQAAVLAHEETSPAFALGAFRGGTEPEVVDKVIESFRTGRGITYEEQGSRAAAGLARMTGQSSRLNLTSRALPALGDVEKKLDAGGLVLDVGCGAGVALLEVAKQFPQAQCIGYDPSPSALEIGRAKAAELGLGNVTFIEAFAADVPSEPKADLIMTLDVLHDMPRPDEAAAIIRSALADNGSWLIKEIRSTGDFSSDRRNPMLPLFYGFSLFSCLQSAISEPDGMGLGTLGLHPERLGELVADAGFSTFNIHDLDEPGNVYYEARI